MQGEPSSSSSSSGLRLAESLQQGKRTHQQVRRGKGKRGRVFSDDVFVLGGGAALGGRVGVRLVADRHLHGEAQPLLVHPPYVRHGVPVLVVRRPHRDLVPFVADVDDGAADVVAVVVERLADQTQQRFQPEAVQVRSPLLLGERDQPASAAFVPLVLPHGLDAVLKQGVIAAGHEVAGQLDVVVEGPEIFHRVELGDEAQVGLPRFALVILEEPQRPFSAE